MIIFFFLYPSSAVKWSFCSAAPRRSFVSLFSFVQPLLCSSSTESLSLSSPSSLLSLLSLRQSLSRPHTASFSIFTFLACPLSSISPIWSLPQLKSIDFLPTCLSRLSAGLPFVPARLSVCPPASLHLAVCLSSFFICLLFLFLSSCLWACKGSDSVSPSSSPLSSTPCRTHTLTPQFSSSPSDNVDYYNGNLDQSFERQQQPTRYKMARALKAMICRQCFEALLIVNIGFSRGRDCQTAWN